MEKELVKNVAISKSPCSFNSLVPNKSVDKRSCSENIKLIEPVGQNISESFKNSCNDSSLGSHDSTNIMCSHEKIKVEFNISSGELNNRIKENINKTSKELESGCDIQNFNVAMNDALTFQLVKKIKLNTITSDPFSSDDSLLENLDLSFNENNERSHFKSENIDRNKQISNDLIEPKCFHELSPIKKNTLTSKSMMPDCYEINSSPQSPFNKLSRSKDCNYSPDIFNSNLDGTLTDKNDTEDQAWDMSISIVEEKDKILNEDYELLKNIPVSPGISSLMLSTWVKSSQEKNNLVTTFEDLLKKTLKNNAHKTVVHHPSPRSLFSNSETVCIKTDFLCGLSSNVKSLIKRFKGITNLYEWQEECLNLPAVEKRKNLVYALPTSGGKTLVAEILLLKEILCREKNVLFVLPYVSIAQEKVRALSLFALELGFLVEEYAGSKGGYPPMKRRRKRSVYVATIEKALGLVHSLIECQRIQELGLIVVDELHLIGEPKRGAHLESMLTKLIHLKYDIQIIGMSATIGNLPEVATFLNADVYTQDFRPVELTEYVKVENELFKVDHSVDDEVPLVFHSTLSFKYSQEQKQSDPDQVGALVQEIVPDQSCLVFCPSKKNCENVALLVCNAFEKNILEHKLEEKKALFRALVTEGNGTVCPILRKTLPFGVAYHHSGLTTAERSLLEEAFLAKTICCICCTSTLAAGVNLPAHRVILRSPYVGTQFLTLSKYKQMIGRAGRTGMGDTGESFLMCKPQDAQKVGELLSSAIDQCQSQLSGTGLECLITSAVDLGLASSVNSLNSLCRCSLLAAQASRLDIDLDFEVSAALDKLVQASAITRSGDELALSKIGKAAVKANLDMGSAQQLHSDLQVAQEGLVLLSHLHLLYLITPYTMLDQIHFQQRPFCNAFMELGPKEIQTAKVLGITEQCIATLMSGRSIKENLNGTLHRFYLSLILLDLWNQNSVWKVSNKFLLPRGLVHNFLISASAFAASVVRFCEILEDMWCFKLLLSEMSTRLTHCCTMELLPLMELPAVKIGRAKQLFNAGFKTISIVAKTEPKALVQALDHMPRRIAYQIVAAAKLMLLTKVESLQEEAEDVLEGLKIV